MSVRGRSLPISSCFDTQPPVVVCMADEPRERDHGGTLFHGVQEVMLKGSSNAGERE